MPTGRRPREGSRSARPHRSRRLVSPGVDRPGVRESLVRSLALQSYPLVQVALIDFLVEVREARAAEALKKLVEGDALIPEVKKRAELGLQQITI